MLGTKNNLLPTLQRQRQLSNAGQAGAVGTRTAHLRQPGALLGYRPLGPGDVNYFLVGGYGTVLSQIFSRNFPNYNVGFNLSIPIRNRAAQAD